MVTASDVSKRDSLCINFPVFKHDTFCTASLDKYLEAYDAAAAAGDMEFATANHMQYDGFALWACGENLQGEFFFHEIYNTVLRIDLT